MGSYKDLSETINDLEEARRQLASCRDMIGPLHTEEENAKLNDLCAHYKRRCQQLSATINREQNKNGHQ